MIIFREDGRLGNQLFQYLALRTICRDREIIILLGFEALQSVFDSIEAKIINQHSPRLERYFFYRLYELTDKLSSIGVFSRIEESKQLQEAVIRLGLTKKIKFSGKTYFQGEKFFDLEIVQSLKIRSVLLNQAKRLIQEVADGRSPIFVHIRRGDYVRWPSQETPAILSASYYLKCIDIIRLEILNPFFIFVSDDPFYVQECFSEVKDSYISKQNDTEDFALMTLCKSGILSASSFSWWAAYLSQLQNRSKLFLAPRFWAGHRSGQWFPQFIEADFLSYVDV